MRGAGLLSIIVVAPLAMTGAVSAQEISTPGQGLALAKQVCARCHAVEKGASASPAAGAPSFEDIANTPGMTATALSAALHTSHSTMPNLVLTGDEAGNVIAYILSLKHDNR
jgi:mono/diheme cytochrome c family protein